MSARLTPVEPFDPPEDAPLTPAERKRVREMLEQDEHVMWLWSTIKVLSAWVLGVAAMLALFWDKVKLVFKWIGSL